MTLLSVPSAIASDLTGDRSFTYEISKSQHFVQMAFRAIGAKMWVLVRCRRSEQELGSVFRSGTCVLWVLSSVYGAEGAKWEWRCCGFIWETWKLN